MSREHRSFFNELAGSWHNRASTESLLQSLQTFGINSGDRILDVGAGTGILTGPLLKLIDTGHVFSIDISDKMLRAACQNISSEHVDYICTDACHLTLYAETIDKIICYSTFPHIQRPQCALSEFYRVLKPGGKALIFHNCCSRKLNQHHAKMPHVVSFDKLPKSEYLQSLMSKAGFIEIRTVEQPDLYWVEARKEKHD